MVRSVSGLRVASMMAVGAVRARTSPVLPAGIVGPNTRETLFGQLHTQEIDQRRWCKSDKWGRWLH
jgi:hypothetical protein